MELWRLTILRTWSTGPISLLGSLYEGHSFGVCCVCCVCWRPQKIGILFDITYGLTTHLMKEFICWVDECWPFIEALGLDGAPARQCFLKLCTSGCYLKPHHRLGGLPTDMDTFGPWIWQSSLGGWNSLVLGMLYCNHHDSWYTVCCEKQTIFISNMGHFCLAFVKSYPN